MLLQKSRLLALLILFGVLPCAYSQVPSAEAEDLSIVGMTLEELVNRFGVPSSVYPVRGLEEWQDDVVFVYEHGDYYVFRDRVWQAGLKSFGNVKTGDSWGAVLLALGGGVEERGNSLYRRMDGAGWPLMLKYDFDTGGKLLAIFIYRTDF